MTQPSSYSIHLSRKESNSITNKQLESILARITREIKVKSHDKEELFKSKN